jgi:hypothetical protein
MKKYLAILAVPFIAFVVLGISYLDKPKSVGTTVLMPHSGGTGTSSTNASNVGKYLKVSDDSPFTYTFDSPAGGSGDSRWATSSTDIKPNVSGTGIIVLASSTIQTLNATSFTIPPLTSAITLTNGSGVFAEYAGSTCSAGTKATAISALGAVTCSAVDISADTNLSGDTEIVLTGDALSIASTIARDTELPIGANPTGTIGLSAVNGVATTFLRSDGSPALSQSIIPTWTGLHTFNTAGLIAGASSTVQWLYSTGATLTNATSTNLSVSNSLVIPQNKTASLAGQIVSDDTTGQLRYYAGSAERVVLGYSKAFAGYSTSTTWTGTTTVQGTVAFEAQTFTHAQCYTDTGTVGVAVTDGTNEMNYFVASTTAGVMSLTTNNTFTAGEKRYVKFGTPLSTPTNITCVFRVTLTAD